MNLSRRRFLAASTLVFGFPNWAVAAEAKPFRFGLLADLHHDVMHDGLERLEAFIAEMNRTKVDFVVQLGDFCVPKEPNRKLLQAWEKYPGDRYSVIGNHDTDGGFKREQVVKFIGMPGMYYAFDQHGVRFLVLDGNDPGGKGRGYKRFIAAEQLKWLQRELEAAKTPIVVFVHQPIDHPEGVENQVEVRKLLVQANKAPHPVLAVFAGHNHQNYSTVIDDIPYIQINSASYYWVGEKLAHNSYDAATHKKYPSLRNTCPYKDPLWAIVTIDLKAGQLEVEGRATTWMGGSPWDVGAAKTALDPKVIQPEISGRKIKIPS